MAVVQPRSLVRIAGLFLALIAVGSTDTGCTPEPGEMFTFARSYGGSARETAVAARPRARGGYVFTGTWNGRGGGYGRVTGARPAGEEGDVWVVALDGRGEIEWQRSYGIESDIPPDIDRVDYFALGAAGDRDASGRSGTWLAGQARRNCDTLDDYLECDTNLQITRLDASSGDTLAERRVPNVTRVGAIDFLATEARYEVLAHGDDTGWYITVFDDSLNFVTHSLTGLRDANFHFARDPGGGYVGIADRFVHEVQTIVHVDRSGNVSREVPVGSRSTVFERVASILALADGGFVVAGVAGSRDSQDWWVLRLAPDGTVLWHRRLEGFEQGVVVGRVPDLLRATREGAFILGGTAPDYSKRLLRLDGSGLLSFDFCLLWCGP